MVVAEPKGKSSFLCGKPTEMYGKSIEKRGKTGRKRSKCLGKASKSSQNLLKSPRPFRGLLYNDLRSKGPKICTVRMRWAMKMPTAPEPRPWSSVATAMRPIAHSRLVTARRPEFSDITRMALRMGAPLTKESRLKGLLDGSVHGSRSL